MAARFSSAPERTPRRNPVRCFRRIVAALSLASALPVAGSAQQPSPVSPAVAVAGTVLDASTGAPVAGATISIVDTPLRTGSAASGAFALAAVGAGAHVLRVSAFGYEELLVPLAVTAGMAPLELRLDPSPIALPGFDVTGDGRLSLGGIVLDATSGAGLPYASLWMRNADRRAHGDVRGAFRIPRVSAGSDLLLVERLGYESQYVHVRVGGATQPVVVRLDPDPVALAGITVTFSRLRSRRNAYPRVVHAYDEDRLMRSRSKDVVDFLRFESAISFTSCPRGGSYPCIVRGRSVVAPRVYIDEVPVICGLDMLISYQPQDLHLVEVYARGEQIRIYTRPFMERLARRPEGFFDADLYPPALRVDC